VNVKCELIEALRAKDPEAAHPAHRYTREDLMNPSQVADSSPARLP
jgi:hypothetical protein